MYVYSVYVCLCATCTSLVKSHGSAWAYFYSPPPFSALGQKHNSLALLCESLALPAIYLLHSANLMLNLTLFNIYPDTSLTVTSWSVVFGGCVSGSIADSFLMLMFICRGLGKLRSRKIHRHPEHQRLKKN